LETFRIESEKLDLEIALADIESIHMHEEIIPELVQKLATDLLEDGVLRHPIIVDEDTIVVLDGMHRAAASRVIGCVWIPVCLVDYDNPSIRVETWYRTFRRGSGPELTGELARWNITTRESNIQDAKTDWEAGVAAAFIATKNKCLLIENKGTDVRQNFQLAVRIEHMARSLGYDVSYETENDALNRLDMGTVTAVLAPPQVTKEDVREFGLRNELFPHKATRHIVPARPLGIDVPIDALRNRNIDLLQANRQLIESLRKRTLERLGPGSLIENRRYDEQVFLFR